MLRINLWITLSLMIVLSGCGIFGEDSKDAALIPPSANYMSPPKYPTEAPVYPPLNQPYTPNMLNNNDSRVMNIDRLNVGEANIETYPAAPQNPSTNPNYETPTPNNRSVDIYIKDQRGDYMPNYVAPTEIIPYDQPIQNNMPQNIQNKVESKDPNIIQNSPMLTPNNLIELNAVGMGVAPESTISPSQALALAKRAAIIDAYRQIGEKMYGIKLNAQDTVRDMVLINSVVKTKVEALIKNAEIIETIYKDGLCQITMELKLDGRIWHKILSDIK